jgi:hypothetical protein
MKDTIQASHDILSTKPRSIKESTEAISYAEALSNVAFAASGEYTEDKHLRLYGAALSFAFAIDDAGKVYNDLRNEMNRVKREMAR